MLRTPETIEVAGGGSWLEPRRPHCIALPRGPRTSAIAAGRTRMIYRHAPVV